MSDEKKDVKGGAEKEAAEKESGSEKVPEEKKEGSKTMLYALAAVVVIGAAAILAALTLSGPGGTEGPNDAEVLGAALEVSRTHMDQVESLMKVKISRSDGTIERDGTYHVIFPIEGSAELETFDVFLDEALELSGVGLNGNFKKPDEFITVPDQKSALEKCAQMFADHEGGPTKLLVLDRLNDTSWMKTKKAVIPKALKCNDIDYPYSLEIGDGYLTISIGNASGTSNFDQGVVAKGVTIPAEDVSEGVAIYISHSIDKKLSYSYVPQPKITFDVYDPSMMLTYNITSVPVLVWNCKFVMEKTLATAEMNGSVPYGTEEMIIKTLSCMYNNGMPEELCEPLGVVRDENGTIQTHLPAEYLFLIRETGMESCKPDNETILLEVFHAPGSEASEDQRWVLDQVEKDFGEYMDMKYYCMGEADECMDLLMEPE